MSNFINDNNYCNDLKHRLLLKIADNISFNNPGFKKTISNTSLGRQIKELIAKKAADNQPKETIQGFFESIGHLESDLNKILVSKTQKTYKNIQKFDPNHESIFTVRSYKGQIYKKLLSQMKKYPNKDMYEIMKSNVDEIYPKLVNSNKTFTESFRGSMGKKICEIHEKKMSTTQKETSQSLELRSDKLELSIYLRYGHQVDYPEIAEYVLIFLNKYLQDGYSQFFSTMRLIPREKSHFPPAKVTKSPIIRKIDVSGSKFKNALHSYAIPFFLSHSSNTNPLETPHIISAGMNQDSESDVTSKLELEQGYNRFNSMEEIDLKSVLEDVIKSMKELEGNLSKLIVF